MLYVLVGSPVSHPRDSECYAEPRLNRRILRILYISRRNDLVPSGRGGAGSAILVNTWPSLFLHTISQFGLRLMAFYSV